MLVCVCVSVQTDNMWHILAMPNSAQIASSPMLSNPALSNRKTIKKLPPENCRKIGGFSRRQKLNLWHVRQLQLQQQQQQLLLPLDNDTNQKVEGNAKFMRETQLRMSWNATGPNVPQPHSCLIFLSNCVAQQHI